MSSSSTTTDRLNLVFIHPSANKRGGGIVNAGLSYVEGLLAIGHKVEVWTASEIFATGARGLGAEVRLDRAFRSFLALCARPARMAASLRGIFRADAIVHNNGRLWPLACLVRASRHFVVFHNDSLGTRGLFRNWLSISEAQRRRLAPVGEKRRPWFRSLSRIVNGLDSSVWAPVAVKRTDGPVLIGFLAEIRPKKGLDVLLQAVALLHRRGLDVRLAVGGDGDLEAQAVRARELGIAEIVEWRGWVSDKNAFFAQLDIFCLPSRIEPFGIVLTEAMARGVPVVATRTDGPIELLETSGAGLLVDIDDPEAMADALAGLVEDRAMRIECGASGRAYAQRNFMPAEIGRRLQMAVVDAISAAPLSVQPRNSHG